MKHFRFIAFLQIVVHALMLIVGIVVFSMDLVPESVKPHVEFHTKYPILSIIFGITTVLSDYYTFVCINSLYLKIKGENRRTAQSDSVQAIPLQRP
jgi:hypothetical protein